MTSSPTGAGAPIAIVAGHGDFAAGLVSAIDQIAGCGAQLLPLTNRGLGAAELESALRALVEGSAVRAIFTDLPAGSCTIAARRVLRDHPALRLVVGANLPTVIDFVLAGDGGDVAHAVERGRQALQVVAPPPSVAPAAPPGAAPGAEVRGAR